MKLFPSNFITRDHELNISRLWFMRIYSTRRSGVFVVNFEHILHLVLVFLLLNLNRLLPAGVDIFDMNQWFTNF